MPPHGEAPGEVTLLISKQGETSTYSESAEGQESDFLLHSLPAPQPREDTVKPHFQRLHRHGVLSRSLKLLLIPA